ncbi:MAG: HD domain-containing phosphohydrolase [Pyrinomonadaceae bacterium]
MDPTSQKLVHSFGALADLGQEIANPNEFHEMVRTSLHLLLGTLAIRRGAVAQYLPGKEETECLAVWGLGDAFQSCLTVNEMERLAFLTSGLSKLNIEERNPHFKDFLGRHYDALHKTGIELVIPMVVRGELTGLVLLGGKASGEAFSDDDLEVIQAMVRHVGVGIHTHHLFDQVEQRAEENRRLYDDLRAIYRDTVRAFATAIDIKDKYTQGHSERVGKYSEIIARELGWDEEEVEGIAIAGYLHDIGKLVVERDIINAPYKIDAKQSSELNRHPVAGFEILARIQHPYADIPLTAKYHHERIDGRGYPDGLSGEQIPLGARIVSLADAFDAMTTDRPYKTRRIFSEVIDDFRRNTGTQFDTNVVLALCRALLKEMDGSAGARRMTKMLGRDYLNNERDSPLLTELMNELDPNTQSAAAGIA